MRLLMLAVLPRARGHVSARVMRSDEAVVPVVEAFELLTSFCTLIIAVLGRYRTSSTVFGVQSTVFSYQYIQH